MAFQSMWNTVSQKNPRRVPENEGPYSPQLAPSHALEEALRETTRALSLRDHLSSAANSEADGLGSILSRVVELESRVSSAEKLLKPHAFKQQVQAAVMAVLEGEARAGGLKEQLDAYRDQVATSTNVKTGVQDNSLELGALEPQHQKAASSFRAELGKLHEILCESRKKSSGSAEPSYSFAVRRQNASTEPGSAASLQTLESLEKAAEKLQQQAGGPVRPPAMNLQGADAQSIQWLAEELRTTMRHETEAREMLAQSVKKQQAIVETLQVRMAACERLLGEGRRGPTLDVWKDV